MTTQTFERMLREASERFGHQTAIIVDEAKESYSFASINDEIRKVSFFLQRLGVGTGERVAICLPNGVDFPLFWLASNLLGATVVPIRPGRTASENLFILLHSQATLLITNEESMQDWAYLNEKIPSVAWVSTDGTIPSAIQFMKAYPLLEPIQHYPEVGEETVMSMHYCVSEKVLRAPECMCWADWKATVEAMGSSDLPVHFTAHDTLIISHLFDQVVPFWNLLIALKTGAQLVILSAFQSDQFWEKVQTYEATFFCCHEKMFELLLDTPIQANEQQHAVRKFGCMSSSDPTIIHALNQRFNVSDVSLHGLIRLGFPKMMLNISYTPEKQRVAKKV